jgi:cbb3-type cytochrome oxidase maturation protein
VAGLKKTSNEMKIIFLLIAISLMVAIGFLISFYWAVKSGQYEDDYTPSIRILFEDSPGGDNTGKS